MNKRTQYNILIVDDHEVVLEGTKTLLNDEENFVVEATSDANYVIQKSTEMAYEVYIIDINMKPMNGIILSEKIREKNSHAVIILYTGYDLADYYQLLIDNKIDGILSKVATKNQVIQTIYAALRKELLVPKDFLDFIKTMVHHQKSGVTKSTPGFQTKAQEKMGVITVPKTTSFDEFNFIVCSLYDPIGKR